MRILHVRALGAAVLALSFVPSPSGACSDEIDRTQARVDAMIAAAAATGPAGRESTAATMHRQPTPGSIAAAEERLGDGARAQRVLAALAQARAADRAGDRTACERAIADAQRLLGP